MSTSGRDQQRSKLLKLGGAFKEFGGGHRRRRKPLRMGD
jgi:hypothetical protein